MTKKHKVTVSCGTKFHSDYTAFQLQKHGLLAQVLTAHPKSRYLNRVQLAKKSVTFIFNHSDARILAFGFAWR